MSILRAALLLSMLACKREATQILVHVRTTADAEVMSAVRLEVQRGGETKSEHLLERSRSDLGEIGSFGIAPLEEDLESEIVLELTAIAGGRDIGTFVRRIDGFANEEKRQVFVCLADRCLDPGAPSCGGGLACGIDGCEPEKLATFGAPYASWERCLVSQDIAPPPPPLPPPPQDLDPPDLTKPALSILSVGGLGDQAIVDVAVDRSRGVVIAGRASMGLSIDGRDLDVDGSDAFLLRADSDGAIDWVVHATGAGAQTIDAIELDPLGNVFIAGSFRDELHLLRDGAELASRVGSMGTDLFVARFSRDGAFESLAVLASPGDDRAGGIARDRGVVAVGGSLGGTVAEEIDGRCGWSAFTGDRSTQAGFVIGLDEVELGCRFGVTFGSAGPSHAGAVAIAPEAILVGGRFENDLTVMSSEGRPLELAAPANDLESEAFVATIGFGGGVLRMVQVGGSGRDDVLDLMSLDEEVIAVGTFGPGDRKAGAATATTAGGQMYAIALDRQLAPRRAYATTFPPQRLSASRAAILDRALVIAGSFRGSLALPNRPVLEASGDLTDVFFLRVSRLGAVIEGSVLGASGGDEAHALAIDAVGHSAYVGGEFGISIDLGDTTLESTGAQDAFLYGVEVGDGAR